MSQAPSAWVRPEKTSTGMGEHFKPPQQKKRIFFLVYIYINIYMGINHPIEDLANFDPDPYSYLTMFYCSDKVEKSYNKL